MRFTSGITNCLGILRALNESRKGCRGVPVEKGCDAERLRQYCDWRGIHLVAPPALVDASKVSMQAAANVR